MPCCWRHRWLWADDLGEGCFAVGTRVSRWGDDARSFQARIDTVSSDGS
jgi:hypothetical protein